MERDPAKGKAPMVAKPKKKNSRAATEARVAAQARARAGAGVVIGQSTTPPRRREDPVPEETYEDTYMPGPVPNPESTYMRSMQEEHRSSRLDTDDKPLQCHHGRMWDLDARCIPFLVESGFYPFAIMERMRVDWNLVMALIER